MLRVSILTGVILFAGGSFAAGSPITIDGIEFPQGELSFADAVASYAPVIKSDDPSVEHRDPSLALGLPDYVSGNICSTDPFCTYVSLGDGGTITLQFVDNFLTGSDSSALDLWIFEVGPDVEDTFVSVSSDGINFLAVGMVGGATSGIDLDAFGYGTSAMFSYVRLTDHPDRDDQTGATVGADIDAVGAISTVPNPAAVPEPSTLLLLGSGAAMLGIRRRRRMRSSAAASPASAQRPRQEG